MSLTIASAACNLWETLARIRAWSYRAGLRRVERLRAPVISIGNLTFGGTGKTPFTIWLAQELAARGKQVSVLTRGYRRATTGVRAYPPGSGWEQAGSAHDGDEAQLFLRHLPAASLGISAHRFEAGTQIERISPPDVHLLDDGFQHLRLARQCDVVLIDASNPWGARTAGTRNLPRALREPASALRRVDALILTRCEQSNQAGLAKLTDELRRLHPAAPVFRSSTILSGFRDSLASPPVPAAALKDKRVAAVCGLAHPENFFALLRAAGFSLVATRSFPDHHHYNDQDVDQINDMIRSHGADTLITTEKDVVNLPHPGHFANNFIVPAFWAEISLIVENQDQLLNLLEQKIGSPSTGSGRH